MILTVHGYISGQYSLGGSTMLKLTVATLAALFVVLHVFGDPDRRPTVARDAVNPEVQGLTLAGFADVTEDSPKLASVTLAVSDAEAIRMALAAGKVARAERDAAPMRGHSASVTPVVANPGAEQGFWYVVGSRVNLRQGPGTASFVVAQVTMGMEAEVLESQNGWHRIRLSDGSVSGWIYSKFLTEQRPG